MFDTTNVHTCTYGWHQTTTFTCISSLSYNKKKGIFEDVLDIELHVVLRLETRRGE